MSEDTNPWLSRPLSRSTKKRGSLTRRVSELTGPSSPQLGVPEPAVADRLPVRNQLQKAELWWLGVHGGAGESTMASLVPSWKAASHQWPRNPDGEPTRVVLVARSNMRGLERAQLAATQWAAGLVPHAELVGLVVVADAPGRLPRPLRDFLQVVRGGVPRTWQVPWVEAWRFGEAPALSDLPRSIRKVVDELTVIISPRDIEELIPDEKEYP